MADRLLVQKLKPLLEAKLEPAELRSTFFVRYADPDWHVRLRVLPGTFLGSNLRTFLQAATAELPEPLWFPVHKVQLDAYVRETLRYGGASAVAECEGIFHHDSMAALAFLGIATGERGLDARWRFALLGMDRLLADFGLDLPGRLALVSREARAFGGEFHLDSATRRRMMARYRDERRPLEALLAGEFEPGSLLAEGSRVLDARSEGVRPHVEALRRLESQGRLTASIEDLLSSLMHMHANRVLRSSHRAQEMVIHHYLENAYGSRLARARGTTPPRATGGRA